MEADGGKTAISLHQDEGKTAQLMQQDLAAMRAPARVEDPPPPPVGAKALLERLPSRPQTLTGGLSPVRS